MSYAAEAQRAIPRNDAFTREHVMSVRERDVTAERDINGGEDPVERGGGTLLTEGEAAQGGATDWRPPHPTESEPVAETEGGDGEVAGGQVPTFVTTSAETRLRDLVPTADGLIEPRLFPGCGVEEHDEDCLCDVDLSKSSWDGTIAAAWADETSEDMVGWAMQESGLAFRPHLTSGRRVADFFDNLAALIEMRDPVMRNRRRVSIKNYRYRHGIEAKAQPTRPAGRTPKVKGHKRPDQRPFRCQCGESFDEAHNRFFAQEMYRHHIREVAGATQS